MSDDSRRCEHENFSSTVNVARITSGDDGPVVAYAADVQVQCADCHERFVFRGLPGGLSGTYPTCSVTGHEARLPIQPASVAFADALRVQI